MLVTCIALLLLSCMRGGAAVRATASRSVDLGAISLLISIEDQNQYLLFLAFSNRSSCNVQNEI